MKTYFLKLRTPRPNFIQTITPAETAMMQAHFAYWKGLMNKGHVVAFGPVMGPSESFGIGIMELDDGVDPAALAAEDPAITANAGLSYEIGLMPRGVVLKK
jgi:uncharacterized protein YciI